MKYFFDDKERVKKLHRILKEWEGTPFRHKCGVKGLGCDCVHFVAKVLEEFNLVDFTLIKVPDYPRDWHFHNTREQLSETIMQHLNVEKFELTDILQDGDIILSHFGKAASHAGLYVQGRVYQALMTGVTKIQFNDKKYRAKMKFVYRIIEKV